MAIAQRVAGYSLGAADLLRRAMGKKKKEILDREFAPFAAGMRERGFSDGAVRTRGTCWCPFSDYAFNKAHSAAWNGPDVLLDRLPEGQLSGRIHERAAHLVGGARPAPRSTSPSAGAWASGSCRRTSTPPRAASPPSAPTSASA